MQPGAPMQRNTLTDTRIRPEKGGQDICYMRAMINRLIRNGLIKFTLHFRTGSARDSVLVCVRDHAACVCVHALWVSHQSVGASIYLPASDQSYFPIWSPCSKASGRGPIVYLGSQKSWDGEHSSF